MLKMRHIKDPSFEKEISKKGFLSWHLFLRNVFIDLNGFWDPCFSWDGRIDAVSWIDTLYIYIFLFSFALNGGAVRMRFLYLKKKPPHARFKLQGWHAWRHFPPVKLSGFWLPSHGRVNELHKIFPSPYMQASKIVFDKSSDFTWKEGERKTIFCFRRSVHKIAAKYFEIPGI